jgi:hypothetical protein
MLRLMLGVQQRQTMISQFYQQDRLVVEGGISVCFARRGRMAGRVGIGKG